MGRSLNLAEINQGTVYRIAGFLNDSSAYSEKLYKMGFVVGTKVELAPVKTSDPIVLQIRGSRVALRKQEAREVLVEEM